MFIASLPDDVTILFPGLGSLWGTSVHPLSHIPGCYDLSFDLPPGRIGSADEFDLGQFGSEVDGVIRITREKVYWLFTSISGDLPPNVDTQLLIIRRKDGRISALLPLTTPEYMGTLRGSWHNTVRARFERDTTIQRRQVVAKVALSVGDRIQDVVFNVVRAMRLLRFGTFPLAPLPDEQHTFSGKLTYCTWNSLQPPITATTNNALAALMSFAEDGIRPYAFLIDDGWQDVHNRRLQSFESNSLFLDGMKDLGELVSKAREEYGVVEVGAWHAIGGYWCGVEPGNFIGNYQLIKVTKAGSSNNPQDGYPGPAEPDGFSYYLPHLSSVAQFFDDYYATLANHGITFSKCDNMASLDNLKDARELVSLTSPDEPQDILGRKVDIPSIRIAYKNAIRAAARKHFGPGTEGRVIFCMGMTPRVLLGHDIGLSSDVIANVDDQSSARILLRNSDDYFPNEPDSHRYHVFTNVVGGMFTSQLNVVPDFDMFQSHPYMPLNAQGDGQTQNVSSNYAQAAFHAALRALGAGPVTLTDVPGQTDPSIVSKLVGSTIEGGRSVVVQASQSPFVSNDVFDPVLLHGGIGRAFRVFSRNQGRKADGGTIGYWNIRSHDGQVEDEVTASDIQQLTTDSGEFLVYFPETSEVRVVDSGGAPSPPLDIQIGPFGFHLVTVAPISSSPVGYRIAALGLVDKYNSLAGLMSFGPDGSTGMWEAVVRCSGKFAFWIDGQEGQAPWVEVDGEAARVESRAVTMGSLISVDLAAFLPQRQSDVPFVVTIGFLSKHTVTLV
ncbi:hypothetical protein FRB99_001288 [Tulasnella sp. 403]|nr:hypothetical protein FRB99_001288 [Tulasnella sp. 403]